MTFGANSESGMEAAGGNWSSVFNTSLMAFFHRWASAIKCQSQLCLSDFRNQQLVSHAQWPTKASSSLNKGQAIRLDCAYLTVKVIAGCPTLQLY